MIPLKQLRLPRRIFVSFLRLWALWTINAICTLCTFRPSTFYARKSGSLESLFGTLLIFRQLTVSTFLVNFISFMFSIRCFKSSWHAKWNIYTEQAA